MSANILRSVHYDTSGGKNAPQSWTAIEKLLVKWLPIEPTEGNPQIKDMFWDNYFIFEWNDVEWWEIHIVLSVCKLPNESADVSDDG